MQDPAVPFSAPADSDLHRNRARPASWWHLSSRDRVLFSCPGTPSWRHRAAARHTPTLVTVLAWWPAAITLAALVAASRVYLGVHWATDVTAAAALGAAWAQTVRTVHLLVWGRPLRGKIMIPRNSAPLLLG